MTPLACFFARLPRDIHQHISRYAPADVPFRRTEILRNLVSLFLAETLTSSHFYPSQDEYL
jgi:hypothetical protein